MENKPTVYIGIDPCSHPQPFTWVVLDTRLRLLELSEGSLEDVLGRVKALEPSRAAVNAPTGPNRGLVRRPGPRRGRKPLKETGRADNLRIAEQQLFECGIRVPRTPSAVEDCPRWMQHGFALHRGLDALGFSDLPEAPLRKLETQAEAVFHTLLKQAPFPARSLEGRIQRQILLFEQNIALRDPMEFFEEVTRHRFITGTLPMEILYTLPQLHALSAAFIARLDGQKPAQVIRLGAPEEGLLALPDWEGFDKFRLAAPMLQPAIF